MPDVLREKGWFAALLDFFDRPWLKKWVGNLYVTIVLLLAYPCLWVYAYEEMPEEGQDAMFAFFAEEDDTEAEIIARADKVLSDFNSETAKVVDAHCRKLCTKVNGEYVSWAHDQNFYPICSCRVEGLEVSAPIFNKAPRH